MMPLHKRRAILTTFIVTTCLAGAALMASCSTGSAVKRLATDQAGLLEAGRSMELAELTVRMHDRFQQLDPSAWRELTGKASRLSQSAGQLVMQRATAVSGVSDSEAILNRLEADTAALKQQREQLAQDLARALPGAGSAPSNVSPAER
ncbi:MAG: hypothetical protein IOD15_06540 [Phycisphaerales bacterium]|jgi:hypothetical protein|nr:hypothetical protein [Phycisphaerales bacterium]